MKKKRHYWIVVYKGGNTPVPPYDCNPRSADDGMLVYRSYQAALAASRHQERLYGIKCEPCKLGEED